jgi:phosphoserine phosphatase
LFEIKADQPQVQFWKIYFKAYELGVKFSPVSISDYEIWVKGQRKQRYSINVLEKHWLLCN